MKVTYKRILLKLSGEQLAGDGENGIDTTLVEWIAQEIKEATAVGAEVVVMVGGGNYVRGAQITGGGIQRVTADYMGMLGTLINAVALTDIFNANDLPAHVLTSIRADQVADDYTQRRANHHLQKGRVVIIGGGIGRPYLTTDTAAVSLALDLDCDVVCKITKVDGVYDKDPEKFDDAKRYKQLTFQQAVEDKHVRVMDKAALGLAMEYGKHIIICDLHRDDNIKRIALGGSVGTLIS
ncbi:MAG: UMP kinase [Candidatus Saccharimonadales bacterium]